MGYPWTDEEKLLAWKRAWARVCREQFEQNERDADAVGGMSAAQLRALSIAEYGSAALAERSNVMMVGPIRDALAKHRKH